MSDTSAARSAEWKAHWPVILSAMLGMSYYAMVNYSFDQFAAPIEKELNLSRKEIFVGLSIFNLLPVLFGPPVGALIDRYGTRKIAIPGMILSMAAFASLSLANESAARWYALWFVFGMCALLIKSTVWTVAVTKLFTTSRGLALSVMLSGTAIAEGIAKIYPNWLIVHYDWKVAYMAIAATWGGLAFLAVLFLFRESGSPGTQQTNAPESSETLTGLSLGEAMRSGPIVRIGMTNMLSSLVGGAISMHIALILTQAGLERSDAALVAATAGISGIAGKLITGWLCDRTTSSLLPFSSYSLAAIGYALLLNTFQSVPLLVLGVMIMGYAGGAGFQVTAYLTGRYAGLKNFGKIYASIASMMMLGAAIGPLLSAAVFDAFKSYDPLLIIGIPVVILAALLVVRLGDYPKFQETPEGGAH